MSQESDCNVLLSLSEKYPQIKELFGVDWTFKWKVTGLVLIQFGMLFIMKTQSWPVVILTAYLFGGVINHALMLGTSKLKILVMQDQFKATF